MEKSTKKNKHHNPKQISTLFCQGTHTTITTAKQTTPSGSPFEICVSPGEDLCLAKQGSWLNSRGTNAHKIARKIAAEWTGESAGRGRKREREGAVQFKHESVEAIAMVVECFAAGVIDVAITNAMKTEGTVITSTDIDKAISELGGVELDLVLGGDFVAKNTDLVGRQGVHGAFCVQGQEGEDLV